MAETRDREMTRGVGQALYRYLPGRYIDFYIKSTRDNYSAYVTHWNSEKLEGANVNRLLRSIWSLLDQMPAASLVDYLPREQHSWAVLTPRTGGVNSAVTAAVSPLTFFCSKCSRVTSFRSSEEFLRDPANRYCPECMKQHRNSLMKQIRLIYYCKCGWSSPVYSARCSCSKPSIIRKDSFTFECLNCSKELPMITKCRDCGETQYPRNVFDSAHYYPQSISVIDLVDEKKERFVSADKNGTLVAVAYWFGLIDRNKFTSIVRDGIHERDAADYERDVKKQLELLKATLGNTVPIETLQLLARQSVQVQDQTNTVFKALEKAKTYLTDQSPEYLLHLAMQILEYDTVVHSPQTSTLEEAVAMAKLLNTHANPDKYHDAAKRLGFSLVQACGSVPFVQASYGFTRKENVVTADVKLHAFARENRTKTNIYATRMETEGVLFQLDRVRVLRWLTKNSFITPEELPDLEDEASVKAWFLNRLDSRQIHAFTDIDDDTGSNQVLNAVYELVHSTSHMLIRQVAELCGLDRNSLSEHVFANIPAVFIYCQNSQGASLGAMFNVFEAYFDHWMTSTTNEAQKCIFDPMCMDSQGACAGCLYLNEISCDHFNKDLSRKHLIGWTDPASLKRFYGYWEV